MLKTNKSGLKRIIGSSKVIPCPYCFGTGYSDRKNVSGCAQRCHWCQDGTQIRIYDKATRLPKLK